jgi:hypothetical protein
MIKVENDPSVAARGSSISFWLFAAGGAVGLFDMATRAVPFGQGFEMCTLADNLARHGAFANPFYLLPTGPTAANPPLYPLLLAILIKLLHADAFVTLSATLGNILVNAATAALLPRVSALFYGNPIPGALAAILWLLSVRLMPAWDTSYTVAGLLLFCLVANASACAAVRQSKPILLAALAGLLASALFFFNPSAMLIFLPWIAWLLFFGRAPLRRRIVFSSVILAILALSAFAWTYRNYRQLGHYVVRTNLGMTLYASNNDCAQPSLLDDEANGCYLSYHPNTNLHETQLLHDMGEVAYDRMRTASTSAWIQSHPGPFLRLSAARLRNFWFPPLNEGGFHSVVIWIATLLSIPGLVLMARHRQPILLFILTPLCLYPLMYYLVVSDVRYRYPILWLSLLPAGYGLQWLFQRPKLKPAIDRLRNLAAPPKKLSL